MKLWRSVTVGLLFMFASYGMAGGQSTVIGIHADNMISVYYRLMGEMTRSWPDGLVDRVQIDLSHGEEYRGIEILPDSVGEQLLLKLMSALSRNRWDEALKIRQLIASLSDQELSLQRQCPLIIY